jgi:hypothetical protein
MCSYPSDWHCVKGILLLIAASTLLTDIAFAQGSTITSLNTTDTAGTPTTEGFEASAVGQVIPVSKKPV